jgi:hypothetical protein
MIYVAWVISLIFTAFVSYHYRQVVDSTKKVYKSLERRLEREEAESVIIDPDDLVQSTQIALEEEEKRLNPDVMP